jgi:predicted  nucleic acid-binding Zn-ribbon protein
METVYKDEDELIQENEVLRHIHSMRLKVRELQREVASANAELAPIEKDFASNITTLRSEKRDLSAKIAELERQISASTNWERAHKDSVQPIIDQTLQEQKELKEEEVRKLQELNDLERRIQEKHEERRKIEEDAGRAQEIREANRELLKKKKEDLAKLP